MSHEPGSYEPLRSIILSWFDVLLFEAGQKRVRFRKSATRWRSLNGWISSINSLIECFLPTEEILLVIARQICQPETKSQYCMRQANRRLNKTVCLYWSFLQVEAVRYGSRYLKDVFASKWCFGFLESNVIAILRENNSQWTVKSKHFKGGLNGFSASLTRALPHH